jgi:hypothetical protein
MPGVGRQRTLINRGAQKEESMGDRILVIDYSKERREHLIGRLRERLRDVEVFEMITNPPDEMKNTDFGKLTQLRTNRYDLIIGHIGGNPSGYECLRTFKEHNPKGKAVLYTKTDAIPLEKFEGLKLANAIVRRAEDNSRVFPNDDQMLDVVDRVRKESGLVHWTSPFRDKAVLTTLISLVAATLTAVAAALKLMGTG